MRRLKSWFLKNLFLQMALSLIAASFLYNEAQLASIVTTLVAALALLLALFKAPPSAGRAWRLSLCLLTILSLAICYAVAAVFDQRLNCAAVNANCVDVSHKLPPPNSPWRPWINPRK